MHATTNPSHHSEAPPPPGGGGAGLLGNYNLNHSDGFIINAWKNNIVYRYALFFEVFHEHIHLNDIIYSRT